MVHLYSDPPFLSLSNETIAVDHQEYKDLGAGEPRKQPSQPWPERQLLGVVQMSLDPGGQMLLFRPQEHPDIGTDLGAKVCRV